MDIFKAILENGDKAGSITILLMVIAALIAGQITGYVEIGPQVKERKAAIKEGAIALEKANAELKATDKALTKLQLEKELIWQQSLQRSNPVRTSNRRRKTL